MAVLRKGGKRGHVLLGQINLVVNTPMPLFIPLPQFDPFEVAETATEYDHLFRSKNLKVLMQIQVNECCLR